ncbi:MAG TPA: hypothetical protein G4O11_03230 [Anaerolineae bacterium]|nr:hypothetical protein [Anaerolineae bacterium]
MTNNEFKIDRSVMILRWIARGLGTLIASFWLLIAILSLIYEQEQGGIESTIMALLIVSSILGVVIAWLRELEGGLIILVVAIAHSTFALIEAGHNKGFAVLISGGPFFVIGSLFIATWWRSKRSYVSTNDS